MNIIEKKIKDPKVIWLIKKILENHKITSDGKGMPIGNLTSQFFANVYLNELDKFVKHQLKTKYYIRYVDDFIILHRDKVVLEKWRREVDIFLRSNLRIELHKEKTRIIPLEKGITLLGFRVFYRHRLLKRSNAHRIWKRLNRLKQEHDRGKITVEKARQSLCGWLAYAKFANTYHLRNKIFYRFCELLGIPSARSVQV